MIEILCAVVAVSVAVVAFLASYGCVVEQRKFHRRLDTMRDALDRQNEALRGIVVDIERIAKTFEASRELTSVSKN